MSLSALDLFSIGIGPSSSHTVGPMRAARLFVKGLEADGLLDSVGRVYSQLFGSLGATGWGHGSDKAVILGLMGEDPETVDTDRADEMVAQATEAKALLLGGRHEIAFDRPEDVIMHRRKSLPTHPNGMSFEAFDVHGTPIRESVYYSVGGGFVVDDSKSGADKVVQDRTPLKYYFNTGDELLAICERENLSISEVMAANEQSWRPHEETKAQLLHIWSVMQECVENGCTREEKTLPGGLKVARRAPQLKRQLLEKEAEESTDPLRAMDWINLYALAVNEENASGGRIVTAPTNGAAGIIPAVLHFYANFMSDVTEDKIVDFMLTAAAIGIIIKENASISGAEVGCQGEVGSACAMAAAGLSAVMGGTPLQVENAAEMGIEHNLGLTCDPVGGLVQIPCIERNAIASVKAINSARLANRGDGIHKVSLDQVVKTMRETGADMKIKYKETSRGGLAVNVIEC